MDTVLTYPEVLAEADEVLDAARTGDRMAAERLLLRVLPRVRNLARYLLRGDRDADDVAQEALSTVYRKLGTYTGEGRFTAWVDRIVMRTAFAHMRRAKARQEDPLPALEGPHGDAGATAAGDFLSRRRLAHALDQLPEEQRVAVVMHHVLEMSVPEIAALVSSPEETVRSRLRLGRSRLRTQMLGQEG